MTRPNRPAASPERPPAWLGRALGLALVVALLGGVVGATGDGRAQRLAAGIAVGAVTVAPLLRVAVLGVTWARLKDRRFAIAGAGVIAVVATGALLPLLR